MEQRVFQKLVIKQLLKNFPAFYCTLLFINVLTKAKALNLHHYRHPEADCFTLSPYHLLRLPSQVSVFAQHSVATSLTILCRNYCDQQCTCQPGMLICLVQHNVMTLLDFVLQPLLKEQLQMTKSSAVTFYTWLFYVQCKKAAS